MMRSCLTMPGGLAFSKAARCMRKGFFTLLGITALVAVLGWYAAERGYSSETDYTCVRCGM